jgi:GTPase SAR1 family protein
VRRGGEFHLCDHARYYFESFERIMHSAYHPTNEDILRLAIRTTGASKAQVQDGKNKFQIMDIGGMRCERKKWVDRVQDADAIFFVASLTDFSQQLFEDESENRMRDSLSALEELAGNTAFQEVPFCVFLTKSDLFEERLAAHGAKLREVLGGEAEESPSACAAAIKQHYLDACPRCSQVRLHRCHCRQPITWLTNGAVPSRRCT